MNHRWQEQMGITVTIDESPTVLEVSGCGVAAANGTYVQTGTVNKRAAYQKAGMSGEINTWLCYVASAKCWMVQDSAHKGQNEGVASTVVQTPLEPWDPETRWQQTTEGKWIDQPSMGVSIVEAGASAAPALVPTAHHSVAAPSSKPDVLVVHQKYQALRSTRTAKQATEPTATPLGVSLIAQKDELQAIAQVLSEAGLNSEQEGNPMAIDTLGSLIADWDKATVSKATETSATTDAAISAAEELLRSSSILSTSEVGADTDTLVGALQTALDAMAAEENMWQAYPQIGSELLQQAWSVSQLLAATLGEDEDKKAPEVPMRLITLNTELQKLQDASKART